MGNFSDRQWGISAIRSKRDTSISALLTGAVEDIVRQDDQEVTRRRIVERLRGGYDLGSDGRVPCGRDDLHDR